ncbi:MAG TPA: diguanylate cyclase [Methylomusa anaerophila]|uniref:Putative diguanylate cyclase YcdT n=1 Tax=Methylomusa anaerophila TaxID=1930071 RepID=A0A348AGQ2_9FIRM|nr:sensor domain-containing diguanylate cyclase [Methylomusa anaerophila]BBB90250.1 putative diguanylate cyclase YcdT [Methylomusa anaerophila]HML89403.1 diguanylate cyclase [Methylomusa anaerophila]
MQANKEIRSSLPWDCGPAYAQMLLRIISVIFAFFPAIYAVAIHEAGWFTTAFLAAAYIAYNSWLSWRRILPQVKELWIDLSLVAGMTLLDAVFVNILYHLVLARMVLRVGRQGAWKVTIVVAAVFLAASVIGRPALSIAAVFPILYNIIGFATLSFTAIFAWRVMDKQTKNEGRIAELVHQSDRHYRLALTDELTGLYNYRAYQERTPALEEYILIMLDIDHFKKLNDCYGHSFGNDVLKTIGDIIHRGIRDEDMAFRYGGEEFAVILPNANLVLGLKIAERLRERVESWEFYYDKCTKVPLTISVGLSLKKSGITGQEAFRQADIALYRAKRQGRNNVQCYQAWDDLSERTLNQA